MRQVGVIDIGSNTIKLLIASEKNGVKTDHVAVEESRISTGISEEHPLLQKEPIERALRSISNLVSIAEEWNVDQLKIIATSAVRDAVNGKDFAQKIEQKCGYPVEILSGQEEAENIAYGLKFDPSINIHSNYFHFDLGGGSLEFNKINKGKLDRAISMPLGAVRLTEKFIPFPHDPVPDSIRASIEDHVLKTFITECIPEKIGDATDLVFTGGSATISRALACKKPIDNIGLEKGYLSKEQLTSLYNQLASRTFNERIQLEYLPKNRADVICAALIILLSILRHCQKDGFSHSFYSLRHGASAKLLGL